MMDRMPNTRNASRRREFLGALPLGMLAMTRRLGAADDEEVIPFLDVPKFDPENPRLPWDKLTSWVTPGEQFFAVAHYGMAEVDPASWKLEISGLVDRPHPMTLETLRSRPKKEHTLTLECSGNGPAGGLIGNARFTGTPLAPLLKESGLRPEATQIVFF